MVGVFHAPKPNQIHTEEAERKPLNRLHTLTIANEYAIYTHRCLQGSDTNGTNSFNFPDAH